VKRLPLGYTSLVLLAPLSIIVALMVGSFGCGSSGGGSTPAATQGYLELGFVDSPTTGFQQINLNVVSVRFNPSTNPNVSDSDPNWYTIPAPPGAGAAGELALDLTKIVANVQMFNTAATAAQVYFQVELQLDPTTPGTVIPSCGGGGIEGCASYPITMPNGTNLRTTTISGIPVAAFGLTPVVLDISPGTIVPPSSPGGAYTMNNPTISVLTTNQLMASVTGTVNFTGGSPLAGQTINAELTGTNQIVASAPLLLTSSGTSASIFLQLPANPKPLGTTYDIYISGGTATTASVSGLNLIPGQQAPLTFSVQAKGSFNNVSGTIIDGPSNSAISGATVDLLQPPSNNASANCTTTPLSCVVIMTTSTNEQGAYLLSSVPFGTYAIRASNTGNTEQIESLTVNANTPACGGQTATCNITLPGVLISGTVQIDTAPPVGTNQLVTVVAERTGTNILEGVSQAVIRAGSTSGAFTIEVPSGMGNVDLIATAQDAYLGVGTPYTGHTIGVAANINPSPSTGPAPSPVLAMKCAGHGTIVGQANNADANTLVYVSKVDPTTNLPVQLVASSVGPSIDGSGQPNPNANQFSVCVPPDAYQVQRFEYSQPSAGASATATPVGTPVTLAVPAPSATSSPCPSVCISGGCPGVCSGTQLPSAL